MQQHILGAANSIRGQVADHQGSLNEIASGIRGQLPQLSDMAFGGQPGLNGAINYASNVLGGKYLGQGNPYMDSMLSQTRENVGNAVNSTFSMAGRTGGGNHAERLGQGLANAENQMRYQDYSQERDRMQQAGALIPSLTAARYAGVSPFLQASQTAATLPYAGVQNLAPLLGGASGAGQSTQSQPSNIFGNVLGAVGMALPFIPGFGASDRNLKTNISQVGELADGLKVYDFEYRRDLDPGLPEGRHRGVMAQDVAVLRPWAVEVRDGRLGVNYGAL